MEKDLVYLTWTNSENSKFFKVPELYKQEFAQINETDEKPHPFAAFRVRLPDKRRPEIKRIWHERV